MKSFKVLLSSPKDKNPEGDDSKIFKFTKNLKTYNSFIRLESEREVLYHKLREIITKLDEESLYKIFDVKDQEGLKFSIELASDILNMGTLPAIERFSGELVDNLNYNNLDDKMKDKLNSHLLFIDPLFGILRSKDYVPNYKLSPFADLSGIKISEYWQERVKNVLEKELRDSLVIDLLDSDSYNIIEFPKEIDLVKVEFKTSNSEKLKSELINYLINLNRNISRDDLMKFSSSSVVYKPNESNENHLIFSE